MSKGYANWRIIEHPAKEQDGTEGVYLALHQVQYDPEGHPIFASPPLIAGSEQYILGMLNEWGKAFTLPSLLESEIKLPGLGAKLDA